MGKSIKNLSSVTVVGLDIAKNVFQVHGVDAKGAAVVARAVRRGQLLSFFASLPRCLVGIEACSSAYHWARALSELGHRVKLIPPAYVKPYVRRSKNDAVDAAAICEAVGRPNMRFVPVRSVENQAQLMRHRARELLAGNRTRMLNALRGHLAEIGVVAAQGAQHAYALKRLARRRRRRERRSRRSRLRAPGPGAAGSSDRRDRRARSRRSTTRSRRW